MPVAMTIHRMPWMVVKDDRIVAYGWTREQCKGATTWAGTFRGGRVVPNPVAAKP